MLAPGDCAPLVFYVRAAAGTHPPAEGAATGPAGTAAGQKGDPQRDRQPSFPLLAKSLVKKGCSRLSTSGNDALVPERRLEDAEAKRVVKKG